MKRKITFENDHLFDEPGLSVLGLGAYVQLLQVGLHIGLLGVLGLLMLRSWRGRLSLRALALL